MRVQAALVGIMLWLTGACCGGIVTMFFAHRALDAVEAELILLRTECAKTRARCEAASQNPCTCDR